MHHLVWFKEPVGEGLPFAFFYLWLVLQSDDERKERLSGLGKSLWSSIEVGAQQQQQQKPY